MNRVDPVKSAWEACPMCRGHVMHVNTYNGEVDDGCGYCNDRGEVRRRDDNGRFVGEPKP